MRESKCFARDSESESVRERRVSRWAEEVIDSTISHSFAINVLPHTGSALPSPGEFTGTSHAAHVVRRFPCLALHMQCHGLLLQASLSLLPFRVNRRSADSFAVSMECTPSHSPLDFMQSRYLRFSLAYVLSDWRSAPNMHVYSSSYSHAVCG